MPKSKASRRLRNALETRSRKWRRRQVIGFYLMMLLLVACRAGDDHHGFRHLWFAIYPLLVMVQQLWIWRKSEPLLVTNLDDRAQLEHGVNFDQLSAAEQHEMLGRHRVGGSVKYQVPDERQEALQLRANESAFRFLRVSLLWFIVVYWALYLWLPAGDWRDALTDSPVILSCLVVFVISLPQVIAMWTEPDAIGETRLVPEGVAQH